jgi:hypothetical protein
MADMTSGVLAVVCATFNFMSLLFKPVAAAALGFPSPFLATTTSNASLAC